MSSIGQPQYVLELATIPLPLYPINAVVLGRCVRLGPTMIGKSTEGHVMGQISSCFVMNENSHTLTIMMIINKKLPTSNIRFHR